MPSGPPDLHLLPPERPGDRGWPRRGRQRPPLTGLRACPRRGRPAPRAGRQLDHRAGPRTAGPLEGDGSCRPELGRPGPFLRPGLFRSRLSRATQPGEGGRGSRVGCYCGRVGFGHSPPERFRFLRVPFGRLGAAGSPKTFQVGAHNINSFAGLGTSKRWECARCGVSAGRIDGSRSALPANWTGSGARTFCLSCSRALAGEEAQEAAPAGSSREDLIRIRRRGLIEFEIRRAPEAPNRTIARACRTSTGAVAAVREAPGA